MSLYNDVLQLAEGGDYGTLCCQPSTNFDRSTKLDLTTEPPFLGRCCYMPFFFLLHYFSHSRFNKSSQFCIPFSKFLLNNFFKILAKNPSILSSTETMVC